MSRRVFFSFEYEHDVQRAMVVRNSWVTKGDATGFIDAAAFEKLKRSGESAVKSWIDEQLKNTSVTVVLVGQATCNSKWVAYEIERSVSRGNGLLGIDVSKIKNWDQQTSDRCGELPNGYPFYLWFKDDGYENMPKWIEAAAKAAGR